MSQGDGASSREAIQQLFNRTLVTVAIQVGCLTLLIIVLALLGGLWLDRTLETLPLFMILFLVGSMPVTWVVIFQVVNRAKKQLDPNSTVENKTRFELEVDDSDTD